MNTIEFLNKINDEVKTKITVGNRYITGFIVNKLRYTENEETEINCYLTIFDTHFKSEFFLYKECLKTIEKLYIINSILNSLFNLFKKEKRNFRQEEIESFSNEINLIKEYLEKELFKEKLESKLQIKGTTDKKVKI